MAMRRRNFGSYNYKLNDIERERRRMKGKMLHTALHKTVKPNAQYLLVQ